MKTYVCFNVDQEIDERLTLLSKETCVPKSEYLRRGAALILKAEEQKAKMIKAWEEKNLGDRK